jgi:hypothetical protein
LWRDDSACTASLAACVCVCCEIDHRLEIDYRGLRAQVLVELVSGQLPWTGICASNSVALVVSRGEHPSAQIVSARHLGVAVIDVGRVD